MQKDELAHWNARYHWNRYDTEINIKAIVLWCSRLSFGGTVHWTRGATDTPVRFCRTRKIGDFACPVLNNRFWKIFLTNSEQFQNNFRFPLILLNLKKGHMPTHFILQSNVFWCNIVIKASKNKRNLKEIYRTVVNCQLFYTSCC